jgi:hypothetical protein
VTPAALGTPWFFTLTNDDTTPLRLVTDGRLLTLDVARDGGEDGEGGDDAGAHAVKRSGRKPPPTIHCTLPGELRPATDGERVRVLAPGVSYVEVFDPRLYCFEGRDEAALVPGSRVTAHLGWPSLHGGADAPPFVVDEAFGGDQRTGVKELTAEGVSVPPPLPQEAPADAPHKLAVTTLPRIDAEIGSGLLVEVWVENTTSRPIRLMLRPETLAFEVASTKGVLQCSLKSHQASPIAEVFAEAPPHGKLSTSVLLASVCPDGTFREAGLYTVTARVDTRHASGRSIGIETFDGLVKASAPTLVRVRHDRAPRP